jgi:hypothetical protein
MVAIEAPLSSGRELTALDFDFDIDDDGALEIDCLPSSQSMREEQPRRLLEPPPPSARGASPMVTRATPPGMRRVGSKELQAPSGPASSSMRRVSSGSIEAVDPHDALVAFAGFGKPPSSLWSTPSYALRVFVRRSVLRRERAIARRHRKHDVAHYEAALRAADSGAVRRGVLVIVAELVLGLLFCVAAYEALSAALAPR